MIETIRLTKRFSNKTVLHNLNFKVAPGEFVALLGPNGAGKSTLLRILASLLRPSFGKVRVAHHELPNEAASVRRHLGIVSHQPLLYADLTAKENLVFYGRLYNIPHLDQRVAEILETVDLAGRRNDLVRTFSRGMQQRLAIGRAVLHNPDVLLLDEPHTGLDQDACEMLDGVLRLVASQGRTVVMASHDLARAAGLASRYDVISRGSLRASAQRVELPIDGLLTFYRNAISDHQPSKFQYQRSTG